eukprot:801920-Amphidinium_carterae.1
MALTVMLGCLQIHPCVSTVLPELHNARHRRPGLAVARIETGHRNVTLPRTGQFKWQFGAKLLKSWPIRRSVLRKEGAYCVVRPGVVYLRASQRRARTFLTAMR